MRHDPRSRLQCKANRNGNAMAAFLIAATIVSFLQFSQAQHPFEDIAKVLDEYPLPKLNHDYHEFQPSIDEQTMKVHHSGHHAAYTKKMNAALKEWRGSVRQDIYVMFSLLACEDTEIYLSIYPQVIKRPSRFCFGPDCLESLYHLSCAGNLVDEMTWLSKTVRKIFG